MPSSDDGKKIVRTVCTLGIEITLSENLKFRLEQMRVAMRLPNHEEVIASAFREYVEAHGFSFSSEPVDRSLLEQAGLAASGNVQLLKSARGTMMIHLPYPIDDNWYEKMKATTQMTSFNQLLTTALQVAYDKYIKRST